MPGTSVPFAPVRGCRSVPALPIRWCIAAACALLQAGPSTVHGEPPVEALPAPSERRGDDEEAARRLIQEAIDQAAAAPAAREPAGASGEGGTAAGPVPVDPLMAARISAELAAKQLEARRLAQRSPADALDLLDQAAKALEDQSIPTETRTQLLRRIERTRRDIEETTGKRRAELALEKQNEAIEGQIDRERARKVEVDQRIAMLVEEYNALVDERRFAEAEAIAKKAGQLAPDNPVVRQLLAQSRLIRRLDAQRSLDDERQAGFLDVAEDIDGSAAPFAGPIEFPATKDWQDLTKNRAQLLAEGRSRASAAEQEIHRKLDTPVKPEYRGQPLAEVIDALGRQAGVAIHLDMVGLEQEAVRSTTPVTLALDQPISLKSALKLLLEPLHLGYAVRDEVLKVTSPRLVRGEVYAVTYPVADLVLPIPNFSADGLGMTGALRDGYNQVGLRGGLNVQVGAPPPGVLVPGASTDAPVDAASLAQLQTGGSQQGTGSIPSIPLGGVGGGGQQNFQPLIDLIQSTVQPQTWDAQGGPGAIRPFDTNLSLVVSQTQEVHEEIADLLEQLRRLQDLQVTIEVRFITLNDTFFERIGVDFDFNIQTNVNEPLNMTAVPNASNGSISPIDLGLRARPGRRSQTIGLDNAGNPGVALSQQITSTQLAAASLGGLGGVANAGGGGVVGTPPSIGRNFFSIPFRQNSFGSAQVPIFPGMPDPVSSAANFGFAILSDIEAYFLIQAAQGNTRSNVMQAPKVTLFNGQQAFISDMRQRPFVTSVVPVVGDFAAAQQPVITVLNEGTSVNVQAVVSNDRRFVRLTLVPFFSQIGRVDTFQFEGSRSTRSKSSDERTGADGELPVSVNDQPLGIGVTTGISTANETELQSNGTTIQQPEFIITTVTTTVSVPDGGTVLLGGIKRQREGRNEFGVPILSKIPYINRLFRNVGLGRTTDSLMLMVTPRIIIQEEEEEKLLGTSKP